MLKKVKIIIFVNNREEASRYFKLFHFMLGDKVVVSRHTQVDPRLETDDVAIQFLLANDNARGYRATYVINLTRDEEFHNTRVALIESCKILPTGEKFNSLF